MTPKRINTATIDRSYYASYWQRANELWESMKNNVLQGKWNAAVIDGVQATISANDALTVAYLGKRSTSDNHVEVLALFEQAFPFKEGEQKNRLRKILSIKSHVEYGPSLVKPEEGQRVFQDVERFLTAIKKALANVNQ